MTDSGKLLADYSTNGSEAAFRELVAAYLNLVHSTAFRLVGGDAHLAEDVAQMVFTNLARKARSLPAEVMLGGWLHRDTCFVAGKLMRGERRRRFREQRAAEMNSLQTHPEADPAALAPILDEAINQLAAADRAAIVLRYFERRDHRAIGEALGSSENAAQKRVARALEELRVLLKRRGVAFSTASLGAVLAAGAVSAVPAGLAVSIAGAAVASTVTVGGTAMGIFKIMSITKIQIGGLAALVMAGAITMTVIQNGRQAALREENQRLRQQLDLAAQLQAENASMSNQLAQATRSGLAVDKPSAELLRLRREVSRLRNQLQTAGAAKGGQRLGGANSAGTDSGSNYIPSETWTNAGFASPLDALQTSHWAVHNGDVAKFKESVVITDDARQLLNGLLTNILSKLPPDVAAEMAAQVKQQGLGVEEGLMFPMMAQDQNNGYKGYQILSQESPSSDETALSIQLDMNTGQSQTNAMRFKRFGDRWKQILDVADLPADVRNQAALGK